MWLRKWSFTTFIAGIFILLQQTRNPKNKSVTHRYTITFRPPLFDNLDFGGRGAKKRRKKSVKIPLLGYQMKINAETSPN